MARQALGVAGGVIGAYFGGPVGAQIGFAIGSAIGGMVDPEKIQGPKLGEVPVQTGRDGVAIPYGWGIIHTAGNIIQKNPVVEIEVEESQGKGGGSKVVSTRRLRTYAIGVCRGPIAGILRIWENDKLVYDRRNQLGVGAVAIPVSETNTYAENITIYLGDEDQLPDPELEGNWGVGTTPAFRGLAYITWNNYDITDFGSVIPQYRFEVQVHAPAIVTSRIYPIEAKDRIDLGIELTAGSLTLITEDQVDDGHDLVGLTMRTLLQTTDVGEDQVDDGHDLVGVVLRQILKTTDAGEDLVDDGHDLVGVNLRQALVEQVMVPEKLQIGIAAPTGSMSAI